MKTINLKSSLSLKLTTFIFCMVLFSSCDPIIGYKYIVNNKSDKELIVYSFDTSFIIKPKTETIFFETEIMGSNPHDEKDDFLQLFDTLRIEASDKSTLSLDYLKRENWTYSCEPSHFGVIDTGINVYEIEISNEDFKWIRLSIEKWLRKNSKTTKQQRKRFVWKVKQADLYTLIRLSYCSFNFKTICDASTTNDEQRNKHRPANIYASRGRHDAARKRRLNRIYFAAVRQRGKKILIFAFLYNDR